MERPRPGGARTQGFPIHTQKANQQSHEGSRVGREDPWRGHEGYECYECSHVDHVEGEAAWPRTPCTSGATTTRSATASRSTPHD